MDLSSFFLCFHLPQAASTFFVTPLQRPSYDRELKGGRGLQLAELLKDHVA